jgi:predicted membrane-bound mannosyltransferase
MIRRVGSTARGQVTVEHVIYGLCLIAAIVLRFHDLAAGPMSSDESLNSWPAWRAAVGQRGERLALGQPPTSALLFSLQSLVFWLGGMGSDGIARLPSAAIGSVLVLVPYLLRHILGRLGALALSALFVADPVLLTLSRTADGAILSACCWLLTLGCLCRFADRNVEVRDATRWLYGGAIAAGLLLVSGRQAWTVLALTALSVPALRRLARSNGVAPRQVGSSQPIVLLAISMTSALVGATTGFAQWQGPSYVASSLTAWLEQWQGPHDFGTGLHELIDALIVSQLPLVALAVLGVAVMGWPRDAEGRRAWRPLALAAGLTFALACSPAAADRMPLTLVLALAAAGGVAAVARFELRGSAEWFRLAVGILLILLAVRGAADVIGPRGHRAKWLRDEATDPAVRRLAEDVAFLSVWRFWDAREHPIRVVASPWADPLLGWYLRDLTNLRWVLAVDPRHFDASPAPLLITRSPSGPEGPDAPIEMAARYAGTRYRIRRASPDRGTVILWVRRD